MNNLDALREIINTDAVMKRVDTEDFSILPLYQTKINITSIDASICKTADEANLCSVTFKPFGVLKLTDEKIEMLMFKNTDSILTKVTNEIGEFDFETLFKLFK